MKSSLVTRNIRIRQRRTSVRLEPQLWRALEIIADQTRKDINTICTDVAEQRGPDGGFTSALRVYIVQYFAGDALGDVDATDDQAAAAAYAPAEADRAADGSSARSRASRDRRAAAESASFTARFSDDVRPDAPFEHVGRAAFASGPMEDRAEARSRAEIRGEAGPGEDRANDGERNRRGRGQEATDPARGATAPAYEATQDDALNPEGDAAAPDVETRRREAEQVRLRLRRGAARRYAV